MLRTGCLTLFSHSFAFVAYENQLSTVLAVDNFTGAEVLGRTLRCDHVPKYRIPKVCCCAAAACVLIVSHRNTRNVRQKVLSNRPVKSLRVIVNASCILAARRVSIRCKNASFVPKSNVIWRDNRDVICLIVTATTTKIDPKRVSCVLSRNVPL